MQLKVKPKEATAIINSLVGGVVPKIGVQHITVGRTDEVTMLLKVLEEVKQGHGMMKFWIGDYGSGKSFMLHLLNTVALKQKFVVTQADFTPHIRLYSNDGKGQALYSLLMDNLAVQTRPEGGALPVLLEKWIEQVIGRTAKKLGVSLLEIRESRYSESVREELMATINEITEVGSFDFGLAVVRYYDGFIMGDDQLRKNALRWMKGEYTTKTEARHDLGVSDIVNDRNYYDMLKNFSRLFVSMGYSGWVINLDEAVNLYKIINPGMRQRNYEKLLNIYNDCFQGRVEHLFFNVAGTSEFMEDPKKGLYSYEALKSRLQVNKFENQKFRDLAQPVIRLVPLTHDEIFVLLHNLKRIFDFNYQVEMDFSEADIHHYMEEIYNKPGAAEFLTPREVIRDFLNILNVLRQNPEADKKQLIKEIRIENEREDTAEPEQQQMKRVKLLEKQLKQVLLPPEVLEVLAGAMMDDEHALRALTASYMNHAGTLIATERRLIFINKEMNITSFPYGLINEMSYTSGPQYSVLQMLLNKQQQNIDFIPNNQLKPLLHLLEAQLDILERKTLVAELKYWQKEIKNPEIQELLNRMSRIAYIIQEKGNMTSEVFSVRHSETVTKMLKQYHVLEAAGLESPEMIESRDRLEESLKLTCVAFEQELNNIFQSDMLDVDAESKAYLESLKSRGLIN